MKHSRKTPETDTLRVLMIEQGLSVATLAGSAGVEPATLANQIAANFPSLRLRMAVEHVVGKAIWSATEDFNSRRDLIARCGFDPYRMTVGELAKRLSLLKIRGRSKGGRRRTVLLAMLREALADKPPTTNPPQQTIKV